MFKEGLYLSKSKNYILKQIFCLVMFSTFEISTIYINNNKIDILLKKEFMSDLRMLKLV